MGQPTGLVQRRKSHPSNLRTTPQPPHLNALALRETHLTRFPDEDPVPAAARRMEPTRSRKPPTLLRCKPSSKVLACVHRITRSKDCFAASNTSCDHRTAAPSS